MIAMKSVNSLTLSWKLAAGILVALNLFIISGNALAMPPSGLDTAKSSTTVLDLNGRSGIRIFHFMAGDLCSKATGQCIEIAGSGSIRYNDKFSANGHLLKYDKESVKQAAISAHYDWTAKELVNSNAIRVHFKAMTGLGMVTVAITEGKTPTTGLVCVWGTLTGILAENETLCTNKVTVYVK
jgi:hypothetical protein